jgi:hypothetical protein
MPSDRSRSQSPMNSNSLVDSTSQHITPLALSQPVTTTSDLKSMDNARKTSLSDLDKELQEFDIDLDKDDVSDVDIDTAKRVFKTLSDEDEVNAK